MKEVLKKFKNTKVFLTERSNWGVPREVMHKYSGKRDKNLKVLLLGVQNKGVIKTF